jgi:hypothetical protein
MKGELTRVHVCTKGLIRVRVKFHVLDRKKDEIRHIADIMQFRSEICWREASARLRTEAFGPF